MASAATTSIGLPATTAAGLPVTYAVVSGPAQVSGDTLTVNGAGTVVIAASQPGNSTYAPFSASETLTVLGTADTPAMQTWTLAIFGSLLALTAIRSLRMG